MCTAVGYKRQFAGRCSTRNARQSVCKQTQSHLHCCRGCISLKCSSLPLGLPCLAPRLLLRLLSGIWRGGRVIVGPQRPFAARLHEVEKLGQLGVICNSPEQDCDSCARRRCELPLQASHSYTLPGL